jgi:hypothetical protein
MRETNTLWTCTVLPKFQQKVTNQDFVHLNTMSPLALSVCSLCVSALCVCQLCNTTVMMQVDTETAQLFLEIKAKCSGTPQW